MSDIFNTLVSDDAMQPNNNSNGLKFGINPIKIISIEFKKNNFVSGGYQLHIKYGNEDSQRMQFIDLTPRDELYHKNERVKKGTKEYAQEVDTWYKQKMAVLVHIVKAYGVTEEILKKKITEKKPKDLLNYAKTVLSCLPKNYKSITIDAFLMYQWNIKKDNDRTFLELGDTMKKGYFLSPHVEPVGEWNPVTEENGDVHWEDEEGNIHPIKKSKYTMESNWAKLQEVKTKTSDSPFGEDEDAVVDFAEDLPFEENADDLEQEMPEFN